MGFGARCRWDAGGVPVGCWWGAGEAGEVPVRLVKDFRFASLRESSSIQNWHLIGYDETYDVS